MSDESDSDRHDVSEGHGAHRFFDIEASESDSQGDLPSDPDSASENFLREQGVCSSFPQFGRLPPELRHRVWELFCPDLTAKARIYDFRCYAHNDVLMLQEGAKLSDQTAAARIVLSVNSESRSFALKSLRHAMTFNGNQAVFRFNKETDIISISNWGYSEPFPHTFELPGSTRDVTQISVDPKDPSFSPELSAVLFRSLPELRRVYVCVESIDCKKKDLRWCASDLVNRCYSEFIEEGEAGLPYTIRSLMCWPDVINHREFAEDEIPLESIDAYNEVRSGILSEVDPLDERHIPELWPLVVFEGEKELRVFEKIRVSGKSEVVASDEDEEEDSDASTDELDEYESEGIDDSEIDDEEEGSGEEDDLEVASSSSEGSDDSSTLEEENVPDEDEDAFTSVGKAHYSPARFSSPEAESPGVNPRPSGMAAGGPSRHLKRARHVIASSDSEEDDVGESVARKKARLRGRHDRRVLSDSEESESQKDKVDKDEEDGAAEEEDDNADDDEDEGTGKPMSLAEKLAFHRRKNPTPSDSGDDSGRHRSSSSRDDPEGIGDFRDNSDENEPFSGSDRSNMAMEDSDESPRESE
ncbi:hypothetical protein VTK73DRAFT_3526 [Phialemonium thermophilum]|uniref:2EXR domain-containing protein n=1 Tax=Phialemonium thermophilum TaxID=223376 RepID=A0ABR3Y131_9PEZI